MKNQIRFAKWACTVILCLFLIVPSNSQEAKDPNFLIIFADDLTYRAIGYNNNIIKTPNLDKLAQQGIVFNMAFTATPVCTASRASILTGLFPQKNGTVALNTASFIKNIVKEEKYRTLPHFMNDAGYATYFSGKSHLGDPRDYGFQFGEESFDYDDVKAFQDVSGFISQPNFGDKPFFIWLAPRQPHVPLKPEREWLDLYPESAIPLENNYRESPPPGSFYNQGLPGESFYRDSEYTDNYKDLPAGPPRSPEVIQAFIKAYYATISHLDYQIGKLVDQLREKNQLNNTIIIFLSDNGYLLGNHGLGNKLTMHEESVRIPMFIYWEKIQKRGVRSEALISSVDLLPTVLDLAGINVPDYLHGISLQPILSNPTYPNHTYVISESVGVGGKLGSGHRMVRTDNWKYILSDINDEALYNLDADPYELENLIEEKENQEILWRLRGYLSNWKDTVGDKKPFPDKTKEK